MTRDEVFKLAAQAIGNPLLAEDLAGGFSIHAEPDDWVNFAALVIAAEREACARLCEETPRDSARCDELILPHQAWDEGMEACARAIRARGDAEAAAD